MPENTNTPDANRQAIYEAQNAYREASLALTAGVAHLVRTAERLVHVETNDLVARGERAQAVSHLISVACSNQARWSGGHTAANLIEQVMRNVALERLRRELRGV